MTSPEVTIPRAAWSLWFRWVGAHIAGLLLTLVIVIPLLPLLAFTGMWLSANHLANDPTIWASFWGVSGALFMGIIASLQWLVLRTHIPHAKRWRVTSMIGGAVAGISLMLLGAGARSADTKLGETPGMAMIALVGVMFIIGAVQWLVIRKHLPGAGWWILVCVASGLIGGAIFFLQPVVLDPVLVIEALVPIIRGAVGGALSLVVYSITTGIVLVWRLRQAKSFSS